MMRSTEPSTHPRVVVVGAGFGGLEAVRRLARAPVDVTLIDRRNYHLFQPLLYQVATAALSPADIAWPIRSIFAKHRNVRVELGRVVDVDLDARAVVTESGRRIAYDQLVLATGSRHAYFGHDEWESVAPGLKKIDDATLIRQRLLLAFERAEVEPDAAERRRLLTFVIVGAGPTGVEMAGAIAELARFALATDFRHIDPSATRIVLLDAGDRALSGFPAELSQAATRALEGLGVEVVVNARVEQCDIDGVRYGEHRIEARTVLWCAGVAASPAAKWAQCPADRAGRALVEADLTVPGRPEIFVIGDSASVQRKDGRPVPGVAPAAKQMGRYVAGIVAARVAGGTPPAPFAYKDRGNLATIGRKAAVADFGRLRLNGFSAWLVWGFAHIYFLIGWRTRLIVGLNWFWNYLTLERGARLITGATEETPDGARPDALGTFPERTAA